MLAQMLECFQKVFYFVIVKIVIDQIETLFPDNKTHKNREIESRYMVDGL